MAATPGYGRPILLIELRNLKGSEQGLSMKGRTFGHLSVVGRLPDGYVILCQLNGDEYSFLAKALGISVECPHCGATRCGADLAQEYYSGSAKSRDDSRASPYEWTQARS
jgi:hypothetical protein